MLGSHSVVKLTVPLPIARAAQRKQHKIDEQREKKEKGEDISKCRKPTHNLTWFHTNQTDRVYVHGRRGRTLLNFGGVQLETLTPLAKKITSSLMAAKNSETLMAKASHMNLSL